VAHAACSPVIACGRLIRERRRRPRPPSMVAEKVVDIVDSGTGRLRHPVGPDAEGFLGWREAINDEERVACGALSDDSRTGIFFHQGIGADGI
jgi:hypothetical protein